MRKSFIVLLILLIMALGLVACAGSSAPDATSPTEPAAEEPAADTSAEEAVTLTIATVNNPDMKVMESLTAEFEKAYPGIKLEWVVLPENELRARVTTDVATVPF